MYPAVGTLTSADKYLIYKAIFWEFTFFVAGREKCSFVTTLYLYSLVIFKNFYIKNNTFLFYLELLTAQIGMFYYFILNKEIS